MNEAPAASDTPADARRQRRRRAFRILLAVAITILVLVATFPTFWGPALVASYLRGLLSDPKIGGRVQKVERVSLHQAIVRGIVLDAVPGRPRLDRLELRYSLPVLLRHGRPDAIEAGEFLMDLSEVLPPDAARLFTNHLVRANGALAASSPESPTLTGAITGDLLDWPVRCDLHLDTSLADGFSSQGEGLFRIPDTEWSLSLPFRVSTNGWEAAAILPRTPVDESNAVLGRLANRALEQNADGVSNLVFRGFLSADFRAWQTPDLAVPQWNVEAFASAAPLSLVASENPVSLEGLEIRAQVSGIASHWDLHPVHINFRSGDIGRFHLDDGRVRLLADEQSVSVSEAFAGFCGGHVRLYSLSFRPESLSAGFTLYLEGIDAGEFLTRIPSFRGTATGRLHGRIPLRVTDGKTVRLRDAFLYSIPGETGTIRISDPTPITDALAASGVDKATRDNLARALRSLDYNAMRIDLHRNSGDDDASLAFLLAGTATEGRSTVPVHLAVTFHGPLERLVNTGIRAATGPASPR